MAAEKTSFDQGEEKWIALSREDAKRHPLYGTGGWLTLIWIYLLVIVGSLLIGFLGRAGSGNPFIVLVDFGLYGALLYKLVKISPYFHLWLAGAAALFLVSQFFLVRQAIEIGIPPSGGPFIVLLKMIFNVTVFFYAFVSQRINITYRRGPSPSGCSSRPRKREHSKREGEAYLFGTYPKLGASHFSACSLLTPLRAA